MEKELFHLNFDNLLKYPDKFDIKNRYEKAIPCQGFCTCCEDKLQRQAATPPLMSHGCSIDDIRAVIGDTKKFPDGNDERILFLLENPGGDCGNGMPVGDTIIKNPPVYHFYFTPNIINGEWPTTTEEIEQNCYGNYFAYIIYRYALNNVYITNCVKCEYYKDKDRDMYELSKELCVERFLREEIRIFVPQKVIFFGQAAERIFRKAFPDFQGKTCCLWHPAARRSRKDIIEHNDEILVEFLRKI